MAHPLSSTVACRPPRRNTARSRRCERSSSRSPDFADKVEAKFQKSKVIPSSSTQACEEHGSRGAHLRHVVEEHRRGLGQGAQAVRGSGGEEQGDGAAVHQAVLRLDPGLRQAGAEEPDGGPVQGGGEEGLPPEHSWHQRGAGPHAGRGDRRSGRTRTGGRWRSTRTCPRTTARCRRRSVTSSARSTSWRSWSAERAHIARRRRRGIDRGAVRVALRRRCAASARSRG